MVLYSIQQFDTPLAMLIIMQIHLYNSWIGQSEGNNVKRDRRVKDF